MRNQITIRQALQHVADNPVLDTDELINVPACELVCRTLFEIANSPTKDHRGSMSRANAARTMIFDRLVGRRRAGSHPATRQTVEITFADLAGELGR
jgi:hypothetical protein